MRGWDSKCKHPLHGMYSLIFIGSAQTRNEWLEVPGRIERTDETPHVIPLDSKLVGWTFTNKFNGRDAQVELYRAANNVELSQGNLIYSYSFDNIRTGVFPADVDLAAGDKIGVYMRDQGGDPNDMILTMYFVPSKFTWQLLTNNLAQDFSV